LRKSSGWWSSPVEDDDRAVEIERLRKRLSEAKARKTALLEEAQELVVKLPDIRSAFGNPFFYSRPEHADESAASYSGYASHEVVLKIVLPMVQAFTRVEDDIRQATERLRELGVGLD
jgi:hypothetical protein